MVEKQSAEKITRSFELTEPGVHKLISTNIRALLIEDIIISKDSDEKTILAVTDGTNNSPFLFLEENKTKIFSSPHGWLFWNGAGLQVRVGSGVNVITVGYYLIVGDNFEKWRSDKEWPSTV